MRYGIVAIGMLLGTTAALAEQNGELKSPVRLEAGGQPIDVDVGHAAPFVDDFDGDGVKDLLVGQFGEGKLRIHKNVGTDEEPRFKEFTWFKAGGGLGQVPAG